MSMITDFWKWIQNKMGTSNTTEVSSTELRDFIDSGAWNKLALYDFYLHVGINLIAGALSKCEVRTFLNWEEKQGEEYYLWNFEPNRNENASQFLHRVVGRLIYTGECLVIPSSSGHLLVADTYTREQYALYPDVFRDVTVSGEGTGGNPFTFRKSFRASDVLFYRLQNDNLRNLMDQLQHEYSEMLTAAETKFLRAGGERGILYIDAMAPTTNYGKNADGTVRDFNQVYAELMNKSFKSYFRNPNAVMPLWSGFRYENKGAEATKKSTSEVKDVTDLSDEIKTHMAMSLNIPPALMKGDIADVTKITQNFITFGIDPVAKMMERENNRKRNGTAVLTGTYQKIDTATIQHVNIFDEADHIFNLVGAGYSLDEVRRKAGDVPLNTEWSRMHYRSKNFMNAAAMEEGNNEPAALTDGQGNNRGKEGEGE